MKKKPTLRKRVNIVVPTEAYERLRLNIHRAGLPFDYFADELAKVIVAIDATVQQLIDLQAQGHTLTDCNVLEILRKEGLDTTKLDPQGPKTPNE